MRQIAQPATAPPTRRPATSRAGLYQKPPQLAKDGVEDDPDGVTYWKIAHGIRLTGMPAFGVDAQRAPGYGS